MPKRGRHGDRLTIVTAAPAVKVFASSCPGVVWQCIQITTAEDQSRMSGRKGPVSKASSHNSELFTGVDCQARLAIFLLPGSRGPHAGRRQRPGYHFCERAFPSYSESNDRDQQDHVDGCMCIYVKDPVPRHCLSPPQLSHDLLLTPWPLRSSSQVLGPSQTGRRRDLRRRPGRLARRGPC